MANNLSRRTSAHARAEAEAAFIAAKNQAKKVIRLKEEAQDERTQRAAELKARRLAAAKDTATAAATPAKKTTTKKPAAKKPGKKTPAPLPQFHRF